MQTGKEGLVDRYLSPQELWIKPYPLQASSQITIPYSKQYKI
jgi:hypothetical protein